MNDVLKRPESTLKRVNQWQLVGQAPGWSIDPETDVLMTDNTNADIETRKLWVKVARDFEIPIRLIRFTAPARLCEHNDSVRALNTKLVSTISSAVMQRQGSSRRSR